jgi:hypothetical protein
MSSPRSRNRTQGAFGNRRPRPIGVFFENNEGQSPTEAAPELQKQQNMADKIAVFCHDLIQNAEAEIMKARANNLPNSEIRHLQHTLNKGAMNIGIRVWNASILGEKAILEAKKALRALPQAEETDALVESLLERKAKLFPDDKYIITNFLMPFSERGGGSFRVTAVNVNPEGVQKADLSDLVKVGG